MRKSANVLKMLAAALLAALLLSSCGAGGSQPTGADSEPPVTAETAEAEAAEASGAAANDDSGAALDAAAAGTGVMDMGDSWNSFQFAAAGDVYRLPMVYAEFTAMGWSIPQGYTARYETLLPNRYMDVHLKKGDLELTVTVENFDVSEHAYQDCYITDVSAFSLAEGLFFLPGGLTPNRSSFDDVISMYGGKHSPKNESSTSYSIDYFNCKEDGSRNYDEDLTLGFNAETDIMEWCHLTCKTVPDDFEPSKADSNPNIDYREPTAQSKDLNDGVFSYDGALFRLPCPVSAFLDKGWAPNAKSADVLDKELAAGYTTLIYLEYKKDYFSGRDAESGSTAPFDSSVNFHLINSSTSVQTIRNCTVERVEFDTKEENAAQFSKKIGFAFPIATKADIEKAKTEKDLNMTYSMSKSNDVLSETYTYQTEDKSLSYTFYYTDGTLYKFFISTDR